MKKILALILLLSVIAIIYKPTQGFASSFSSAYLRLANQQSSSPLSGTICAQPSSAGAGTENKVIITFPAGFTVSQNPLDWSTDVSNIPSGAISWPSIGATATGVSGQSVTFSSSDLTLDTLYCFNFTASASTTGSAGNDKTGTLITKNSSNVTIDSTTYAVSVLNNNQIGITASIDPYVSDLPVSITSLTPGTQFAQNSTIQYQITYGLSTTQAFPLTIQAQWTQGTVGSDPTPSVDILDYVIGSASNAYGGTPAVVDTVNRTITWTISSIPGGTSNQTVTFSLKTNNSYTGGNSVSFDVLARSSSGSTTTPDESLTQTYLYDASLVPSPTPTPTPSETSTTTTTTTATPTPAPTTTPQPLSFSNVTINSLSQSSAKILVTATNNSTFTIQYGTSPDNLSQTVTGLTLQQQALITLPNLKPNTDYYFRIIAKDENGNVVKSDIFTFTTAVISTAPEINLETLTVTSNRSLLINPAINSALNEQEKNIIVMPRQSVFEIQFALKKTVSIKNIQAIIRNKNVLGFNTFMPQADAASNFVNLIETSPGVYTGKISAGDTPGIFEIYIRITDFNGNISEQKIATLRVTTALRVFKKGTTEPIENAKITLFLYNQKSRIYTEISPEVLPIQNPIYSLANGTYDLTLPYGKYKAEVSAIGFYPETVEFEISPTYGDYPTIYLKQQPFSMINTFKYYASTFFDTIAASENAFKAYASSNRLFDFITLSAMMVFVFSAFASFSARTHIPLFYIPYFFIYKLKLIFFKNKSKLIFGQIINEENKEKVSKANVYLIDAKSNEIIAHTKTNKLGEFFFNQGQAANYKISVMKKGFVSTPFYEYTNEAIKAMPITLGIKKQSARMTNLREILFVYTEDIFGVMLEGLLMLAVLLEVYFIFTFGFLRIAPFLSVSSLNIILLLVFIYKPKKLYS